MFVIFLGYLLLKPVIGCTGNDLSSLSQLITDPTLSFQVSPSVRWTYYPTISQTGQTQTIANYFPGQSRTQDEAMTAAQSEIKASLDDAYDSVGIISLGSSATMTYSPDEISNCYLSQVIPPGTIVGLEAGGTITNVATIIGNGGTGIKLTSCPLSETNTVQGLGELREYRKDVRVILYNKYINSNIYFR